VGWVAIGFPHNDAVWSFGLDRDLVTGFKPVRSRLSTGSVIWCLEEMRGIPLLSRKGQDMRC
jgi:hypothetical protein